MSILRMKIVFLAKKYGCSTAPFKIKIRVLKGLYLQNEKVLEAQIFGHAYIGIIYVSIGNVN